MNAEADAVKEVIVLESSVVLWILAILVPMALSWCTTVFILLRDIKRTSDRLLDMHINADREGFGTVEIQASQEDIQHALRALVHYIKWTAQELTGKIPPPPID